MSIMNEENREVSVDSTNLISEVTEDLLLFGENFKVYAVYSYNDKYKLEYISDYVDAEAPEFEKETMTLKEFEKLKKDYEQNIESLKLTKHKLMTLDDLLVLLKKQNEI